MLFNKTLESSLSEKKADRKLMSAGEVFVKLNHLSKMLLNKGCVIDVDSVILVSVKIIIIVSRYLVIKSKMPLNSKHIFDCVYVPCYWRG